MEPQHRLKAWMDKNGLSNSALAQELGFGYDHIYAVVTGLRAANEKFQFRFEKRFGITEANKVFGATPQPQPKREATV